MIKNKKLSPNTLSATLSPKQLMQDFYVIFFVFSQKTITVAASMAFFATKVLLNEECAKIILVKLAKILCIKETAFYVL